MSDPTPFEPRSPGLTILGTFPKSWDNTTLHSELQEALRVARPDSSELRGFLSRLQSATPEQTRIALRRIADRQETFGSALRGESSLEAGKSGEDQTTEEVSSVEGNHSTAGEATGK